MSEHDEVRKMLALLVSGALDPGEEERVAGHASSCAACSKELDAWRLLAGGLRQIPTPQPSANLVEQARARAGTRLAEEAEYRWNRGVMILLMLFAWALTLLSWPLVRLASGGLLGMLDPRLNQAWLSFAVFATLIWLAGGAAATLLALQKRRERSVT